MRLIAFLLALFCLAAPALAVPQGATPPITISVGCGISEPASASLRASLSVTSAPTGSPYAITSANCGQIVSFSDTAARSPTIGSSGWFANDFVNLVNHGSGAETITGSSVTIDAAATFVLQKGQSATLIFNGFNWVSGGGPFVTGPSSVTSGHLATFADATGQRLQDGGAAPPVFTLSGSSGYIETNNGSGNFGSLAPTGNGTYAATSTGAGTNGNIVKIDANGNHIDSGVAIAVLGASAQPVTTPTHDDAQYYNLFPYGVGAADTQAPSQNVARCTPFLAPGGVASHIDQVAMTVSTLGTGPLYYAFYTDAIDATTNRHQPQTFITNSSGSFTVTSAATVTGAVGQGGTGVAIPVGLNWFCTNDSNSNDAVRFISFPVNNTSVAGLIGSSTAANVVSTGNITSIITSETAGTWPSFVGVTFTDSTTGTVPLIAARIASAP